MKKNELSIDDIQKICKAEILSKVNNGLITKFSNDTREIKQGEMFISIKPEKGDGIRYIDDAFSKGAIGCITEYELSEQFVNKYKDKIIIRVKNTIKAIQQIAEYKRRLYDIPVVGITGSVGKTTTKEMIASVLRQKYKISKNRGNYNNGIGVPLTILDWDDDIEVAIVEMGMNHLGEIRELTNIAKPTIAVVTNVGTAHIGYLGSRENILKAKLEILEGLPDDGIVVFNNDNDMLQTVQLEKYKKITYAINYSSDYMAKSIEIDDNTTNYSINIKTKEYNVSVNASGEHFVWDSMCAMVVGDILNVEPQKMVNAISKFTNAGDKRSEIKEINNITLINDCYNANYDSMKAGLETLAKTAKGRSVAILGDMFELGNFEEELHRKVGEEVVKNNIDVLITVGTLGKIIADEAQKLKMKEIYSFESNNKCISKLNTIIKKNDTILVKASKGMWFGEIIHKIEEEKWIN